MHHIVSRSMHVFSILLIILLMTGGVVSFIAAILFYIKMRSTAPAIGFAWDNTLQCDPEKLCPLSPNDDIWKKPIEVKKGSYQSEVGKRCVDLVNRVVKGEKGKIPSPPGLTKEMKLMNNPDNPVFGVIWKQDNIVWISFRGTLSPSITTEEWVSDFNYNQTRMPTQSPTVQDVFLPKNPSETALHDIRVGTPPYAHRGFLNIYKKFRDAMWKKISQLKPHTIIVTGHSLGAGVAAICYMDMRNSKSIPADKVIGYTFASPRVGNETFSKMLDPQSFFRIVNTTDVVPALPPSVSPNFSEPDKPSLYQHGGKLMTFTSNWQSINNNHELPVYSNGLKNFENLV